MSQQSGIPILQSLSEVYPGIQGELENRHTNFYSLVNQCFRKAYQTSPQLFICVNRTINLIEPKNIGMKISMGCQNGIIIAVSRTYKDSPIFVNGKGLEDQIVFSCKGAITKNEGHKSSKIIKEAIEIGIQDCPLNNLCGGIIYFHSQLPKDDLKGTMFAFALAAIVINEMENDYSLRQIQKKIENALKTQIYKQKCIVNKMVIRSTGEQQYNHLSFNVKNTKFVVGDLLITEEETEKIKTIEEKLKLQMEFIEIVVCRALDLQKTSFDKLQEMLKVDTPKFKEICEKHVKQSYQENEIKDIFKKDIVSIQQFSPRKRLNLFFEQLTCLEQFLVAPTEEILNKTFKSMLETQRSLGLISERIEKVMKECLSQYGSSCCLLENKYLIIVTTKQKFIWLFELFKKNVFIKSNGEAIVEGNVQHLLFSTGPSTGVALLDLSNQMWY